MFNAIGYFLIYILALLAISMTVGFAWFLIVRRAISIDRKAAMRRIEERRELNGLATKNKIDL